MRPWQEIMGTLSKNQVADPLDNIDKTTKPTHETEFCPFVDYVGSTHKLNFQESDEQELFEYLLESITTGGAYARLWPNIKSYCRRTLVPQHFSKLLTAYEAKGTND